MTPRTLHLSDPLQDYLRQFGYREAEPLQRLRHESVRLAGAGMLLAPEQGQFMGMLARVAGVERYLEIGTFTGYSTLAVALALGPSSRLVTCDIDAETTKIAQRHWRAAGVAGRIELRLGPALATLDALRGHDRQFDMAFIDADKENLLAYYQRCLGLVRPGGLILIDNTLWGGAVADDRDEDHSTKDVRAFNTALRADVRVDMVLLPLGDGLTLARIR
jgi:caffeoyl-CoA O-methyltransferase